MKTLARTICAWVAVVLWATTVAGELIPTPTFSNHAVPTAQVPHTDPSFWQWVDVALLCVALILSTYFALVSRSRRHMLVLTIACLIWFGFIRDGCICSIGSLQNVALACSMRHTCLPVSVALFFLLPLLFTIFFGRTFCASVCPLGALQEVVAVRSLKVPRWLDESLGLLPYLLSRGGGDLRRDRHGVHHLPLRSVRGVLPAGRERQHAGVRQLRADRGRDCGPAVLSLSVSRTVRSWDCCRASRNGTCASCPASASSAACVKRRVRTGRFIRRRCRRRAQQRLRGKRQLLWILAAVPLATGLLAWIGTWWAVPLSRFHPTVRLAEQIRLEELGLAEKTDASDAYRNTGQPLALLYDEAREWQQRFVRIGGWLGAWVGLVLSVKLVQLSIRRRRTDYHPQQAGCVSCGRCFKSCPVELVRLGLIQDVSEMVKETPA